jgi:hypothetical protein
MILQEHQDQDHLFNDETSPVEPYLSPRFGKSEDINDLRHVYEEIQIDSSIKD